MCNRSVSLKQLKVLVDEIRGVDTAARSGEEQEGATGEHVVHAEGNCTGISRLLQETVKGGSGRQQPKTTARKKTDGARRERRL